MQTEIEVDHQLQQCSLQLWMNHVYSAGKKLAAFDGQPMGFLKATIGMASGGMYDQERAMAVLNHVEPYLRSVVSFLATPETTQGVMPRSVEPDVSPRVE